MIGVEVRNSHPLARPRMHPACAAQLLGKEGKGGEEGDDGAAAALEEAVQELTHSVVVQTKVASATQSKLECAVEWTAPMAEPAMKRTKRELAKAQQRVVEELAKGGSAKSLLEKVRVLLSSRWMSRYRERVLEVEGNEAALCAVLQVC